MYHIVIPVDEDESRAAAAARFVTDLSAESGLNVNLDDVSVSIVNVFEEFQAGLSVDLVRRHGEPGQEVVEYAASVDADNIVVPGRKRSPVGKAVFGSVTQDIVLDADMPVTIV